VNADHPEVTAMWDKLKAADIAGDRFVETKVAVFFLDRWLEAELKARSINKTIEDWA
jgi:hypothetical protein